MECMLAFSDHMRVVNVKGPIHHLDTSSCRVTRLQQPHSTGWPKIASTPPAVASDPDLWAHPVLNGLHACTITHHCPVSIMSISLEVSISHLHPELHCWPCLLISNVIFAVYCQHKLKTFQTLVHIESKLNYWCFHFRNCTQDFPLTFY